MSMTRMEYNTRNYLINLLRKQGYPTYARILKECDLNFHNPSQPFAASMDPKTNAIYINPTIQDPKVLSTLIRHEILHNYLHHHMRLMKHLANKNGVNFQELDDMSINELEKELYSTDKFNISADYEISNRGYTDADKEIQRSIGKYGDIFIKAKQNGFKGSIDEIRGLVTEDDHPDWVYDSVEDMYDKLTDELEKEKKKVEEEDEIIDGVISVDELEFFDINTNTIYGEV